MTTFIGAILIIVGLLVLYALVIRPLAEKAGVGAEVLCMDRAAELALFKKSETVLVGRMVWLGGLIVLGL